ncbi:MAG: OmpA family protein [Planctomycetaceae bacterium]|jgi:chemotaxis protein MotB|nr:OmpA family protein [Planctomycetaceae bacterium]
MSRKKKSEDGGVPGWIVTYGDMMSLLLTFFIMLYAISSLDVSKAKSIAMSMRQQFGYKPQMYYPVPGSKFDTAPDKQEKRQQPGSLRQEPNNTVPTRPHQEKVRKSYIFFVANSEELNEAAKRDIRNVFPELDGRPQKIELCGHAGPDEKDAPFSDTMDLAYARAFNVRNHLIGLGIKPARIIISVIGEHGAASYSLSSSDANNTSMSVEISLISDTNR